MNRLQLELLVDPFSKAPLSIFPFKETAAGRVLEGLLLGDGRAYCITRGVAIMQHESFPQYFLEQYRAEIEHLQGVHGSFAATPRKEGYYNFGEQWKRHKDQELNRTWGWEASEWLEMFFLETLTQSEELANKIVVDAGCGNGRLTVAIGEATGAKMFGVDASDSLLSLSEQFPDTDVAWVIADLAHLPFPEGMAHLIISNGVVHHTPEPRKTFDSLANAVAQAGKLYVWLYRRPATAYGKYIYLTDALRRLNTYMPGKSKNLLVHAYASAIYAAKTVLRKLPGDKYADVYIVSHDALTPRYRSYHTPLQASLWYFEAGFQPVVLTHWDDPHGFGVVATKGRVENTPGVNYTRKDIKQRFYR